MAKTINPPEQGKFKWKEAPFENVWDLFWDKEKIATVAKDERGWYWYGMNYDTRDKDRFESLDRAQFHARLWAAKWIYEDGIIERHKILKKLAKGA